MSTGEMVDENNGN